MKTQPTIDDGERRRRLSRALGELADGGVAHPPKILLDRASRDWPGIDAPTRSRRRGSPDLVYRDARSGVVAIGKLHDCERCGGRHASVASGFVVDRSGLVVTARHVLDDERRFALGIMTFDGTVHAVREVVADSRRDDLAVLQVDADDLTPLPLTDAEPVVGAAVRVVSHPAGRLPRSRRVSSRASPLPQTMRRIA